MAVAQGKQVDFLKSISLEINFWKENVHRLELGGAGCAKENKSMRRNKLLSLKTWMLLRKHAFSFLSIPSVNLWSQRFYLLVTISESGGLKTALQMSWPLGDAGELGEGGLTQVAIDAKEETTGRAQEEVFSRTILHFRAASYSLCDEQENSSGVSIDYFCV